MDAGITFGGVWRSSTLEEWASPLSHFSKHTAPPPHLVYDTSLSLSYPALGFAEEKESCCSWFPGALVMVSSPAWRQAFGAFAAFALFCEAVTTALPADFSSALLPSHRCVGCEVVLSGIEEQVSRANQHKEQQLGLKQQIESEVSRQDEMDFSSPAWAGAATGLRPTDEMIRARPGLEPPLAIPHSFHPDRLPTLRKPLKLRQRPLLQPPHRILSNT